MTPEKAAELYRPLLFEVSMRILNNMKDAEDVVQDTLIKWLRNNPCTIENTKAYLVKSVTNASLNFKDLLRNKLEVGFPTLLHDILPDKSSFSNFRLEVEQELFEAYKTLRNKLNPSERGVFMLRELFHLDYDEIAEAFEKQSDNCRQLLSRARRALKENEIPSPKCIDWKEIQTGFRSFLEASESGKLDGLISFLKKEIDKHTK